MQNYSIFSQYASNFWELGFNVIPVINKAPYDGTMWDRWITERQTETAIHNMCTIYKDHGAEVGIGLIMNDHVCAVDIDVDDKQLLKMLPETDYIKRGSKGWTLFYKHNGLESVNDGLVAVELLARGRYTVVPPSLWKCGEDIRYEWVGPGGSIEQLSSIDDLPELTKEHWDNLYEHCRKKGLLRDVKAIRNRSNDSFLDENKEYGRNNMLTHLVKQALRDKVKEPESCSNDGLTRNALKEVGQWIWEQDQAMFPDAPWFETDEIQKRRHRGNGKAAALAFAERFYERYIKPHAVSNPNVERIEIGHVESINKRLEDAALEEDKGLETFCPTEGEWDTVPKTGILGELYNIYLDHVTTQPSPAIGLASAISTLATLCCNTWCSDISGKIGEQSFHFRTWPNLYNMIIAPTTYGKDAAQKVPSKVFTAGKNTRGLASGSIASATGMLMALTKKSPRRTQLFAVDEVQKIFATRHQGEAIVNQLLTMFSASNGKYHGAETAAKEYRQTEIANPCPNILGTTTPKAIEETISSKSNQLGLLNRFLFFAVKDMDGRLSIGQLLMKVAQEGEIGLPDAFESPFGLNRSALSPELLALLDQPVEYDDSLRGEVGAGEGLWVPTKPNKLTIRKGDTETLQTFAKVLVAFEGEISLSSSITKGMGDSAMSAIADLTGRASEVISKLAVVHAVSRGAQEYLEANDFNWGAKVYELSIRSFLGVMGHHLIHDLVEDEKKIEMMALRVSQNGKYPIPYRAFHLYVEKLVQDKARAKSLIRQTKREIGFRWNHNDRSRQLN